MLISPILKNPVLIPGFIFSEIVFATNTAFQLYRFASFLLIFYWVVESVIQYIVFFSSSAMALTD